MHDDLGSRRDSAGTDRGANSGTAAFNGVLVDEALGTGIAH